MVSEYNTAITVPEQADKKDRTRTRKAIMHPSNGEPIEYPIDGNLDLHQFSPKETRQAVLDYIEACLKRDILQLRIVHGKGIGVQREIVHSLLRKHPNVVWGATVVDLRK